MGPIFSKSKDNSDVLGTRQFNILLFLQKSEENLELLKNLKRELKNDCVYLLHEENILLEMLNSYKDDEKVILIISGAYGEELNKRNSLVHKRVEKIFIYCYQLSKHKEWAKKVPSIKLVTDDIKELCSSIIQLVDELNHNYFFMQDKINCGYHFNSQDNFVTYMYHSSILKVFQPESDNNKLYVESHLEQAKKDFIEFVEKNADKYYLFKASHKEELLKEILEETLDKKRLIFWYTRDSFFFIMVNRILTTKMLNGLFNVPTNITQS